MSVGVLTDGFDDDEPSAPLLPPDDRLWRHPSELAAAGASAGTASTPAPPTTPTPDPAPVPSRVAAARTWFVAVAAGCVGALVAVTVLGATGMLAVPDRAAVSPVAAGAMAPLAGPPASAPDVSGVAARTGPSVVRLVVEAGGTRREGSAVAFRADGYLLTSAAGVAGAEQLRLVLPDGTDASGRLVGADPVTDVAVVATDGAALPVVPLGDDTGLRVGQTAVTVGARPGEHRDPSVTAGVVSALGVRVATSDGRMLYGLIQTDAPAMAGSWGGALTGADGAVVGITTAAAASDAEHATLTRAVPVGLAVRVGEDLVPDGKASHAWLGIAGSDAAGVLVGEVAPGSPAEDAGLAPGDLLVAFDGSAVTSMNELVTALRDHRPGSEVAVSWERSGQRYAATVTLVERPAA